MDWQPIGTEVQLLTANQQRIKDMLDAGKGIWHICGVMRMRREHVIDEIYEIRKKEVHMAKKPQSGKLNSQQKAAIYQAYKDGAKQQELAKQYGVCNQAISYTIKKMREAEESMAAAVDLPAAAQVPAQEPEREDEEQPAVVSTFEKATKGLETIAKTAFQVLALNHETKPKPAAINQDFENAIDKMIEDSKAEKNAANAEEKSVIAEVSEPEQDPEQELEDCENGIPNTPLPAKNEALPPVVLRAVNQHLQDIDDRIEALQGRIDEIKMEIEEWQKDAEKLRAWRNEQKWK